MALPHGAVGWSAVCDCGISGLYSLTLKMFELSIPAFESIGPSITLSIVSTKCLTASKTTL